MVSYQIEIYHWKIITFKISEITHILLKRKGFIIKEVIMKFIDQGIH